MGMLQDESIYADGYQQPDRQDGVSSATLNDIGRLFLLQEALYKTGVTVGRCDANTSTGLGHYCPLQAVARIICTAHIF